MALASEWSVDHAQTLTFDEQPLKELHIRVVNGTVNVVGTEDATTRVEVSEVEGPPLKVTLTGEELVVAYDDLPWQGFLKWLNRKGWKRRAVVSVSVPAEVRLTVGVVGATAVVSGVTGPTKMRGISGGATLVGLTGRIHADTVSGDIEAQDLGGPLRFNSVSGSLTVVDSGSPAVRADTVSGDMVVDLAPCEEPRDVAMNTVSGQLAIRLPDDVGAKVSATTASGAISSSFAELGVLGEWGAKQLAGTLGSGAGTVHCSTVSGSIAVLRRPRTEDAPEAAATAARKDV
ncbi:DUF4097 family beta strand repeat-containing protein [Streptomyces sp. 6N223]|uniref:DUF4097 family beta strand repeat-containing protein n=1 Tax=Streptomyces sp. 6N223 TaxID=3457412 RepID=UPI003FD330DC